MASNWGITSIVCAPARKKTFHVNSSYSKCMRSQPENQKAVRVELYKPVSVVKEIKWCFCQSYQRMTSAAWFAKNLLFTHQPLDSSDMLSESSESA